MPNEWYFLLPELHLLQIQFEFSFFTPLQKGVHVLVMINTGLLLCVSKSNYNKVVCHHLNSMQPFD